MVNEHFLHLGLGRFVRAEQVLAVQPIEGDDRGPGRRTLVWVHGLAEPLVASRSEAALVADLEDMAEAAAGPRRARRTARGEERPRRRRAEAASEADQDALF